MIFATRTVHVVAGVTGALLSTSVFAQFEFIPAPAPYGARARAVSADGLIVAGSFSVSPGSGLRNYAFVYQQGVASGTPGGGGSWYHTGATSMSADGGTLVGYLYDQFYTQQLPYRRRLGIDAAPVSLGLFGGNTRGESADVSGDGSVVVGHCEFGRDTYVDGQAFRWTESGGMQGLGFTRPGHSISDALAVSRDGNVVVGLSAPAAGYSQAFRWTQSTGIQELPGLSSMLGAKAIDCSADGRIIVGWSIDPSNTGQTRPVRWDDGVISTLPQLPNSNFFHTSTPTSISWDGSIIGGEAYREGVSFNDAVVWIGREHAVLLSDYLSEFDISVPTGWQLTLVEGISDDGRTFVGTARDPTGFERAYTVTIPAPGVLTVAAVSVFALRRRRFTVAAHRCPPRRG